MNFSEETKKNLILTLLGINEEGETKTTKPFYKIGHDYVIRTVTMIYLGEVKSVKNDHLILTNCAWIPDTSRWHEFLKGEKPNEMEPYQNDVIIYKGGILDATEMTQVLKREVL